MRINMPVKVLPYNTKQDAIDTTSRSKTWSRGLSPFFLGPCPTYGNRIAMNVENLWQHSKVYPEHVDKDGEPGWWYFDWAHQGWGKTRAERYPMGKGARPLYSYWNGEKLTYVEARKRIYIPVYASAVIDTGAFVHLAKLFRLGDNIKLKDFDGYDHRRLGMSYKEVVNCDTRKMGHAFVLAMLLEIGTDFESPEWREILS